jgi:uncharacterized integral membrane protein (TIGR00698 family)
VISHRIVCLVQIGLSEPAATIAPLKSFDPKLIWRGLAIAALIAIAAQFLSEHYGGPAMLFALLIGMAFHFLALEPRIAPGVHWATSFVLRLGVALLGLRIALSDLAALGLANLEAIAALIALTIGCAILFAKIAGRHWHYGMLTGGAVAICGASAALAIAAVLPRRHIADQDVLLTVVGVTTLSTAAMVAYPVIFSILGLDDQATGFLIGATIHDVAQVVGAGFSVSPVAGDNATIVKLFRVAMLPIVLVTLLLVLRGQGASRSISLPWFLVAFLVLVGLGNLVELPAVVTETANTLSRACLLVAVAALGMKTSLAELSKVGVPKLMVIIGSTLVLLVAATAFVLLAW